MSMEIEEKLKKAKEDGLAVVIINGRLYDLLSDEEWDKINIFEQGDK